MLKHKRLIFNDDRNIYWPQDVHKIRKALNSIGFDADDSDIQNAYECLSADWEAGWLCLDSFKSIDDIVYELIQKGYLKEYVD